MTKSSPDKAVSPEAGATPAPDTATSETPVQAPEATVAVRTSQRSTMSLPVVVPALLVLAVLLLVCVLAPEAADRLFSGAQRWVVASFDWFYVMALSAFLLFLVVLAASRYGDIRLGPDDAKPEFSFVSWSSMLFAAGMGIGLMYFGVGEPLQHFLSPPTQEPGTPAAAREAMEATFFHWGFHAWAVYGTMGLVLAYFGFRYNLPLTMRSGLYPLLRDRINGPIGHGVDAFALVGTIAGIATTLGYGARQIAAGIHTLTGWETESSGFLVAVIVVVVTLASLSALLGVDKGVRRLSEFNMLLSVLLLSFVVIAGPTAHIFKALSENIGNYLQGLVGMSLRTFAYAPSREAGWFGGWTILYWAWWVSWSPFVGMFIARISRGRTVREFVIGVLLVPTAFNLLWMTAFGNGAIWADANLAGGALAQTATHVDALLFRFFEYLPWVKPVSWLAVLLIGVFFITSADSGALVVNSIAARGNNESPVWQRLFWCVLLGLTSIVLLLAGGLAALQAVTLVAALPVALIMLVLCVGLWRGMVADLAHYSPDLAPATNFWSGQHWRKRLEQIVHQPLKADVQRFLQATVLPAMNEVAAEMQKRGLQAHVQDSLDGDADSEVRLVVPVEKLRDFVYGVRAVRRTIPTFTVRDSAGSKERRYMYEPVTFFEDGRSGYDVQYLRSEELIADILRQYERYLSLSADKRTQMLNRAPGHTDPV